MVGLRLIDPQYFAAARRIRQIRISSGDLPFRDVGYGSSEFRTGLALSDTGSPNVPMPDNYFYEFIPEQEREAYLSGTKSPLLLHQLEQGRRYLILQTGPHGLYRYNITSSRRRAW